MHCISNDARKAETNNLCEGFFFKDVYAVKLHLLKAPEKGTFHIFQATVGSPTQLEGGVFSLLQSAASLLDATKSYKLHL